MHIFPANSGRYFAESDSLRFTIETNIDRVAVRVLNQEYIQERKKYRNKYNPMHIFLIAVTNFKTNIIAYTLIVTIY